MKSDVVMRLAALSAAIAIAAGAFGAHGASGKAVEWLETGAMYQLIHAVAAIALGSSRRSAALVLLSGAAIFAFSLYAMAFGAPRWLGAITPIGGVVMIAGWAMLALGRR